MYCGYITELRKVRPHSNADRLQCAEVFGNTVIVDLNYYEGQIVLYLPIDGQIGEQFGIVNNLFRTKNEDGTYSGGYINREKRNITALKLRGEKSDGLILPITCLDKFTDVSKLNIGEQITTLNGVVICEKYIPTNNKSHRINDTAKKKEYRIPKDKISYPLFVEHTDTSQLTYNKNDFKAGDTIYITLKQHGTSGRTGYLIEETIKKRKLIQRLLRRKAIVVRKWEYISGTRRTIIKDFNGGYYETNEFRRKYHDLFLNKIPKGMTIYYEIVGYINETTPIMSTCDNKKVNDKDFTKRYGDKTVFSYGCEVGQSDIYVYRITMINEDGYIVELPWEQVQNECKKIGVKTVLTFEKFIYTTYDDLICRVEKYLDGEDPIGKTHIREGVVVRIDNRSKFTAFKHKSWYFKVLEGIIKTNATEPDMEEAEELIFTEEYL